MSAKDDPAFAGKLESLRRSIVEREKNAVRAFIELDPVKTARVAAKLMAHEPELQVPQPQPASEPDQVVRPAPIPSAAPSR